jgi:hypothetical protein
METRIKEQQLMRVVDPARCHDLATCQFRLLLSSFACVLLHELRRTHQAGTELATAQVDTIRLSLLKIAARVTCTARRVVLRLCSLCPWQPLFRQLAGDPIPSQG